jgi:hypothetical protein
VTARRSGPASGGDAGRDRNHHREDPNDELALQWDCSTELQDAYGCITGYPIEGAIERNLDEVRALSPEIPGAVALGYHFCFGTLGGWPNFRPRRLFQILENRFEKSGYRNGRQIG